MRMEMDRFYDFYEKKKIPSLPRTLDSVNCDLGLLSLGSNFSSRTIVGSASGEGNGIPNLNWFSS